MLKFNERLSVKPSYGGWLVFSLYLYTGVLEGIDGDMRMRRGRPDTVGCRVKYMPVSPFWLQCLNGLPPRQAAEELERIIEFMRRCF